MMNNFVRRLTYAIAILAAITLFQFRAETTPAAAASLSHARISGAMATKPPAKAPDFLVPPIFPESAAEQIVAADFNGDGKIDLAVSGEPGVEVLMGNGDGSFQPAHNLHASYTLAIAVADMNNDGIPDLVLTTRYDVEIMLGNGNGSFGAKRKFAINEYSYSIAIADFNGDGNLDVVAAVGYRIGGYVAVLLGNGDGTLGTATNYTVHGHGVPESVVVGDFDDDGVIDIAVANGGLYILNGNGDGTFQAARVICPASELAAADLNGDGRMDIVTNYGVLLNEGGGSLHFLRFNSNDMIGGSIRVADFNGDGIPDLVSSSVGILLGRGDGTFKPPLAIYREGPSAGALAVADFNGDGNPDVAQIASAYPVGVAVYLGKGNGTLDAVRNFNTGVYATQLASADFNNDGNQDIAAFGQDRYGNPALVILLGNGNGTLQTALPSFNPVGTLAVVPGDFNNDGKVDLAVLSGASNAEEVLIFLGNGDGTFQSPVISHLSGGAVAMSIADFDGNGTLDIALVVPCYNCASSIAILAGNGDGTFKTGGTFEAGVDSNSIVSADFNNDGIPDLAIANALGYEHEPGTLSVLIGNGDGTFQKQVPIVNAGASPKNIMAADLTGNGDQDLIVTNTGGVFSVIFGHGNGKFSGLLSTTGVGNGPLVIADLNGDGIPDVAVGADGVQIFTGRGDGKFQPPFTLLPEDAGNAIQAASLGPGILPDLIVLPNADSDTVDVVVNDGH
jgi:hypothetical protein